MDMMMPSMDGVTAISTLRAMNPHVKIIAVSGQMQQKQVAKMMGLNIQAFLSKPYHSEQLLKSLRDLLNTE